MAITIGAHQIAGNNSNGATTPAIDSSGASLVICVDTEYILAAVGTLSESKNTRTLLTVRTGGAARLRPAYSANPIVGAGHTATTSGSATFPPVAIAVANGVKASSPFDQENGADSSNVPVTTLATGAVIPIEDNEILFAFLNFDALISSLSIDNGFTILDTLQYSATNYFGLAVAYKINIGGSGVSVNPAWAWTGAAVAVAAIATFKADAVGAGEPARIIFEKAA